MTLHQDTTVFRQLILLAGQHFQMRPSYIEKDYWVTLMLYRLSQSAYSHNVVFKGGTSLSKGYNLINRFSEDVDVAVIHEGLTNNAVKTLIRNVEKGITGDFTALDDPANSKGSMYRKSIFAYPVIMPEESGGIAQKRMILEISAFANPFPYEVRHIYSFIAQYLQFINRGDVIERYQLQSFMLNVLDFRRTLVEKLISLIRFSFGDTRSLQGKIRHFYDLYYLMKTSECQQYVTSQAFQTDIAELLSHDQQSFSTPDGWSSKSVKDSPLVAHFDEVWSSLAPTYQNEMSSLSFTTIPPTNDVGKIVKSLFEALR